MKPRSIYLIPGLGADHRVFGTIDLPGYDVHILVWQRPEKNEPIADYTKRMAAQITAVPFALIGYSFGGVVGAELTKLFPDAKLFLLSSIASRKELPPWGLFGAGIGVNKLLTGKFMKDSASVIRWFFSLETDEDRKLFDNIIHDSDPEFLPWALNAILNWKGSAKHRIHHIHGDADRLLPLSFTTADTIVKGGGHFMVVTHGKEISAILTSMLRETEN